MKTPEAEQLANLILDYMAVVCDCLAQSDFANDRPVYMGDLALASAWLVKLHRGETAAAVANDIAQAGKALFDYYRQGPWGERHAKAAAALQGSARQRES